MLDYPEEIVVKPGTLRVKKGTREECFIPLSERNEPTPNILNKEKRNYIKIEFKDRESYGFQASSRN